MFKAILLAIWFAAFYPGLSDSAIRQFRYASLDENIQLFETLKYYFEHVGRLRYDEEEGLYNFAHVDPKSFATELDRGKLAVHRGQFELAIQHIEQSIAAHGENEERLLWLAVAYMRKAEAENCLKTFLNSRNDAKPIVCTLPICCVHADATSMSRAAELWQRLLDRYDANDKLYAWLLNFCHMAVGDFPEAVPDRYRIKSDFIETFYGSRRFDHEQRHAALSFRDIAGELGVDTHNCGRGVAVEDFNGDGFLDIVVAGTYSSLRYYENAKGHRFIDRTDQVGLSGVKQIQIVNAVDYDNDGWIDLFASNPFNRPVLLRNERGGRFVDVTEAAMLHNKWPANKVPFSFLPTWGDVDNDGDLDLFVARCGMSFPFTRGIVSRAGVPSMLLINDDGRFADQSAAYGLKDIVEDHLFQGAAFGDFDNDGFADLFLSSPWCDSSVLLKNKHGNKFSRSGKHQRINGGFVTSFLDVNHDGLLDLLQTGMVVSRTSAQCSVFGLNRESVRSGFSTVMVQNRDGQFVDRRDFFPGQLAMPVMGASYGDINNDGAYDFYLGTGTFEPWSVTPNLMYLGKTDGNATELQTENISMLCGFGTIQKGHGIVFFDFDNDGDQDVYSSLGGMWPGDAWPNQLFLNNSDLGNSYVKIRLRGRQTNHFGVGAKLRVAAIDTNGDEIVRYYHMDQKTGFGSAPFIAHIGLLDAVRIDHVDVYWPVSKSARRYLANINQLNRLDESNGVAVPW